MVRIPEICNFNPETTILAHLEGGGMGRKMSDLFGAYCCSDCHTALDGGIPDGVRFVDRLSPDARRLLHLDGVVRTQIILLEEGFIKI